jgi:hypothetical protein
MIGMVGSVTTLRVLGLFALAASACAVERQRPPEHATPRPVASASAAPDPPAPPQAKLDGRDLGPGRCIHPPPDATCSWSDECQKFAERVDGPDGKMFWWGFHAVCSCKKVTENAVTAELVVRELGEDWKIITAECDDGVHGLQPGNYLRSSVDFSAMPFLSDRPATVHALDEFFTPFVRSLRQDGGGAAQATQLRARLADLKSSRWVHFADKPKNGASPNVTSYLVGFTRSGHLAGVYTDGERW